MLNIFFSAMLVSLLGLFVIIQHDFSVLKQSLIQQTKSQLDVLSIDFVRIKILGEVETVADTVLRLQSFPSVRTLYYYDEKHNLVFHYFKSKQDRVEHRTEFSEYQRISDGILEIVTKVRYLDQSYGWVYIRSVPNYLNDIVSSYRKVILLIIIGAVVLSYFMARWLQASIAKPIIKLLSTVNYITETHDYTRKAQTTEKNEIGDLYRGVNGMLSEIYLASKAVQNSEAQFRMLLESTNEGIYGMTLSGICTFANPACLTMFDVTDPKELVGNFVNKVINPIDSSTEKQVDFKFDELYFRSNLGSKEITIKSVRNTTIITEHRFSPIYNNAALIGVVATFFDITERKKSELQLYRYQFELEEMVDARSAELIIKNKELEAFTYSVSHDLRAPLRAINGFSTVLKEDYITQLDDDANDFINRIQSAVASMNSLIEGLLMLSKLSKSELNLEKVNITEVSRTILDDLQTEQPGRKVDVVIEDKLIGTGDKKMITILMRNLLANSWKYTNKLASARIEVHQLIINEEQQFVVKDNGAGFDASSSMNVFLPFKRFHRESEFEGTGIGLAIVSRIIERHGGKIWADAEINQGAAFYFTLPKTT